MKQPQLLVKFCYITKLTEFTVNLYQQTQHAGSTIFFETEWQVIARGKSAIYV